jgi:hypothetical protein
MNRRRFIKATGATFGLGAISSIGAAEEANTLGSQLVEWVNNKGPITERRVEYLEESWYGKHFRMDFRFDNGDIEPVHLYSDQRESIAIYSGGWDRASYDEISVVSDSTSIQSAEGVELPALSTQNQNTSAISGQATSSAIPDIIERAEPYNRELGDCWWDKCGNNDLAGVCVEFGSEAAGASEAAIATAVGSQIATLNPLGLAAVTGGFVGAAIAGYAGGFVGDTLTAAGIDFDLLLPVKEYPVTKDRLVNKAYAWGGWKPGTNQLLTFGTWPGHLGRC